MNRLFLVIGGLSILGLLIYFHTRGFIPYDEGWIVNLSARFFRGEVVYKDFELIYTPGVIYVTSLGYLIFGQSILSERLVALINALISSGLLILISRQLNLNKYLSFLVLLTYLAWGPTHINFVWPIMFNITFTFFIIYFLLRWIEKHDLKLIFFAGIFAGLDLLFKQNFGVATILIFIIFTLSNSQYKNYRLLITFIAGVGIVGLGQLAYFNATSSLISFIQDMRFIFIDKFIGVGLAAAPWPWEYPGPIIYKVLKALFYTLPLVLSALSMLVIYKKDKKLIFIPFFVFSYYVLSIKPTPDFVHLAPLLAISGISLSAIILKTNNFRIKVFSYFIFIFLILLGFYTAFFTNYYRWEPKIITDNYYLSNPRAKIFVDRRSFDQTNEVDDFVTKNSKKDDYIYAYLFSPMYYFTSNRFSPVKYDYSSPALFTPKIEKDIINNLKVKDVRVLITDVPMNEDTTSVGKYIMKNYKEIKTIDKYGLWLKN